MELYEVSWSNTNRKRQAVLLERKCDIGKGTEKLKAGMKAAGPEKMDPIIVRRAEDGTLEIIVWRKRKLRS